MWANFRLWELRQASYTTDEMPDAEHTASGLLRGRGSRARKERTRNIGKGRQISRLRQTCGEASTMPKVNSLHMAGETDKPLAILTTKEEAQMTRVRDENRRHNHRRSTITWGLL